ncbi:uncharacterized protein LOC115717832 [Cannabis sativa]|uniref:uncharacterized protein LOC115717832 n=1 Tax=Cannabis sativa TaxID=3483 RepID=UPI0029CA8F8E|nr:uncharacterized protein LOC115717832 [Cannabis sativa]
MGLHEKDLRPVISSIYGFTRDTIALKEMIKRPISLGTAHVVAKSMADFAVIDQHSAYNAVIGRPILKEMKIVTSIYHLTMKFPTPARVGSVRRVQSDSRECYNAALKLAEKKSVNVIYLIEAPPPRQEVFRIEEIQHKDEPDLDPRVLKYTTTAQAAVDTIEVPIDPLDNNKVMNFSVSWTHTRDITRSRCATYQRLVNMMFADLIGETIEVYVDDMLVKSQHAKDHVTHLQAMLEILRRYKMRLNPLKCVFGDRSGKFLGFMVNQQGIKANPAKIKALVECDLRLNQKKSKALQRTDKCEEAFQALKSHLGRPPILSKPMPGEVLSIYLTVSEYSISSILIREDQGKQYSVYYVSKRLLDAETRYPQMEKLAFALVIASRKLRSYFQAHSFEVLTNYPLSQVLAKPEALGRLLKWSVELSQFDIRYKPRSAIKGQALADFILEFPSTEVALIEEKIDHDIPNSEGWTLYVDGASNSEGSGGGIILISPSNFKVHAALRFEFSASNNEAEYEALIAELKLALEMKIEYLQAFRDSQIVVCQVNGEYLARGGHLARYLALTCELLQKFKKVIVSRVTRAHNSHTDALARLASTREAELLNVIHVDVLTHPTVSRTEVMEINTAREVTCMTPIVDYLEKEILFLPEDKIEARKLRYRAARYVNMMAGFIVEASANRWSNALMVPSAIIYSVKCMVVSAATMPRRIATYVNQPPSNLHSITSPWPFAVWGIDLIGELPKGKGGVKYAVVAVDYFTKWVEAKALATITAVKLREFVYNSIICRFGIPYKLISDNGKQFDCKEMRETCDELGIKKAFSSVAYPQSNGQTEAVNKMIKHTIKGKLEEHKGVWPEELLQVFWSYNTTPRSTTGKTPFSLSYGCEAMVPVEVGVGSLRRDVFNISQNAEKQLVHLDLLEEKGDQAHLKNAANQEHTARYFNSKVKERTLRVGDLVLRKVMPNTKNPTHGVFGDNWEGPYLIAEKIGHATYRLTELDGTAIRRAWNDESLKFYYQ